MVMRLIHTMNKKKGITFIEILISIAILSMATVMIFVFATKVKNTTNAENNKMAAFYNNVSAFEVIQKTLNETGNIDRAIEAAIKESAGYSGRYKKTLNVDVVPVIICPADIDIEDYEQSGSGAGYYEKDGVLYYKSKIKSSDFNLSYDIPIYKITINTYLGVMKWDDIEITALVCPIGGIDVYAE